MPGANLGSTAAKRDLSYFDPRVADTFTYEPDAKYDLGSADFIQLPPEEGGDIITVATWEDDIVAQLALQELPTTRGTLYTVPSDRNAIIRFVDLINDTGGAITGSIWIDGVKIVPSKSVGANDTYSRNGIWDITPDTIIEGQASAAGLFTSISGVLEIAGT
jgi:hypothetical protein